MASKRCFRLILRIWWRESEAWPLRSVANSENALKQLLTVFCLFLVARSTLGDQRSANAALERATSAFNQGRIEEAEKQVDVASRAGSKKPEIPNLRGAIFTRQKRYDEATEQFNQALALESASRLARARHSAPSLNASSNKSVTEISI